MPGRREFLRSTLASAGALALSGFGSGKAAASADSHIEILPGEPLGTISPNIYGHFVENLGAVVYDGIWVGGQSGVGNVGGVRRDLIDHMRKIKAPVIRYPGGCFADSYDWRDGVGPRDKRPRRTNFWAESDPNQTSDQKYDPNQFGTNEFVKFCQQVGAQPYLAANLRSLPAEEFYRWVEYSNSPAGSTTLADMRAQNGSPEPFDVKFWGVGNEAWGCGGNFTAEEYAVEFRRYTTWVPSYGKQLAFIASGPAGDNLNWTRGFFEEIVKKGPDALKAIYGWALHHYAWNLSRGKTDDWEKGKGDAIDFQPVDWYELLREGDRMEGYITGHWQLMGELDRNHRVKLIVDEWGPWYRPGSEATRGHLLEQMPTLRDAIFSGMTLDIFNRHADKVAMANCAQLVNCLNSLYLAHEDRFAVTPVGHVFAMYAAHQGGQALRAEFSSPEVRYDRDGKPARFWGLKGSASRTGNRVLLTVVNPDVSAARETQISVRGARIASGSVTTLTASDIHAHNTFDHREAVVPQSNPLKTGTPLTYTFPPASVVALQLELG